MSFLLAEAHSSKLNGNGPDCGGLLGRLNCLGHFAIALMPHFRQRAWSILLFVFQNSFQSWAEIEGLSLQEAFLPPGQRETGFSDSLKPAGDSWRLPFMTTDKASEPSTSCLGLDSFGFLSKVLGTGQ